MCIRDSSTASQRSEQVATEDATAQRTSGSGAGTVTVSCLLTDVGGNGRDDADVECPMDGTDKQVRHGDGFEKKGPNPSNFFRPAHETYPALQRFSGNHTGPHSKG